MKRPTLRDIAEIVGVSIPTVSLVLSGKGRISTAVRYKVMSAAGDVGYLKSRHTVGADELSSRNIGMLCRFEAYWTNVQPFLEPLLSTIDRVLKINRHYLSLIPLTHTMSTEELLERILRDSLKAIISVYFSDLALFERLEKVGIPVVIIGDLEHQDRFCTVGVDDFQGSYDATKYLIGLGHTRIAYIDYPKENQPLLVEYRHFGYKKALAEFGIDADPCYHVRVSDNEDDLLAKRVEELFTMTPKPTALFAHDDYYMMKIIRTLEGLGVAIPEDMSVIAHGDTLDYGKAWVKKMNTMQIDWAHLGKLAADMMIYRLNHHQDSIQVVKIKERLVDRGSCRNPHTADPRIAMQ